MHTFKTKYQRFVRRYQEDKVRQGYLIFNIILPFLIVFLTETCASHSLFGGLQFVKDHPYAFLVNVMIVMASLSLSLLFHRRITVVLIISFFWIALGFINFIVLFFRVTPFAGSDLLLLKDGQDIILKYLNPIQIILLLVLIVFVILVILYFVLITPKAPHITPIKKSLLSIAGSIFLAWLFTFAGQQCGYLETEFRELSVSYRKNGLFYCFGSSVINVGISKPSDYSTETIEQLTVNYETLDQVSYYPSVTPNIVIVQLESFFNINRLKDVTFSRNPLPNLTYILQRYTSGFLNVPVIGAGTVNSEFEMLTGMNIDDFGVGEYPYKTIVKAQPVESIAYDLKNSGYNAFAIHNNTGDFYERNQVYANLGFDTFTSVEYMWPDSYTVLDWCKDDILVSQIQTALNSTTSQDFVFTVSVQGHGSYPSDDTTEYEKHLTVTSNTIEDQEYLNQLTYYANQLYEMDEFIGNLIQMLNTRKESTILVMYGDHLPSLDITDDNLKSGNSYQTEYFIWNNAGLDFEGGTKEAFEITSQILQKLQITTGAINVYHQNAASSLADGSLTQEDYLSGLKTLEYDILYGDNNYYNGVNPFKQTDLTMGFFPISIEGVELTRDGVLILRGCNFTRYSKILINDSEVTTLYLNPQTLVASDITLAKGDILKISQAGLSETDAYVFESCF